MANQKTPTTDTVEDVTVEKVILSGSPFVSGILGPGAYRISAATTPLFFRDPIISGRVVPSSILTCEAQSFSSSPRATITYQWKSDTVDIPNETNETFLSQDSDLGAQITCEVTITNASGNDIALSNQLLMEPVTPGWIYEMDIMPVRGMASIQQASVNEADIVIISGVEEPMKADVNEMDIYTVAGFRSDPKADVNEADLYAVSGFESTPKADVNETDAYATFLPVYVNDLVVVNGDAENVDMSDWTMDSGNVTSVTVAPAAFSADIATDREGLRFFMPDELGQGIDSQMSQVIALDAGDLTLVDDGRCYCITSYIHQSEDGIDHLEVSMEALDAGLSVLATSAVTITPLNPRGAFNGRTKGWKTWNTTSEALTLPTLTRFVKLIVLFKAHATEGGSNSVYADAFEIQLVKIE